MPDPIHVLRTSHELLAATLAGLDPEQVRGPSYADAWSIADCASHLGSQAEIFAGFLEAGLRGEEPAGPESFAPIWARWDAMSPSEQVASSVSADAALLDRIDALSPGERAGFTVNAIGRDLDLEGLAAVRLSEHAVHTWDIAVALDPAAVIAPDAVEVLAPGLLPLLDRATQSVEGAGTVEIRTSSPQTTYVVDLGAGAPGEGPASSTVSMPAEAWIRLVYGRLDAEHTPAGIDDPDGVLDVLRRAYPGF